MDKQLAELSALLIAHPYWWTADQNTRFEFRNIRISSIYVMTGQYCFWKRTDPLIEFNSITLAEEDYRYFSLQSKGKHVYMTDIIFALSNHPEELCIVTKLAYDTLQLEKRGVKEPVIIEAER